MYSPLQREWSFALFYNTHNFILFFLLLQPKLNVRRLNDFKCSKFCSVEVWFIWSQHAFTLGLVVTYRAVACVPPFPLRNFVFRIDNSGLTSKITKSKWCLNRWKQVPCSLSSIGSKCFLIIMKIYLSRPKYGTKWNWSYLNWLLTTVLTNSQEVNGNRMVNWATK